MANVLKKRYIWRLKGADKMDYFKSCFDQVNVFDGIVLLLALVFLAGIATLMLFNVHAGFSISLVLAVILVALLICLALSSYWPEAVKNIYLFGIMLWITTFMLFVSLYRTLFPKVELFGSLFGKSNIYYLIPFIACLITLWWNLRLLATKEGSSKEASENELTQLKFVERNGFYLILAIMAVFLFLGTNIIQNIRRFHLSPFFYLFMLSSIGIQACGVLPLVWAPANDVKRLAWIRHFKTVWYTISIYVFLFGIIALGKSLVPGVISILK